MARVTIMKKFVEHFFFRLSGEKELFLSFKCIMKKKKLERNKFIKTVLNMVSLWKKS